MAAVYPGTLPVTSAAGALLSTNPHSTLHNNMYDEIVAIATELGVNPRGTYATVKARLDAIPLGAWTSWTPVVVQSNTPTLTNNRSRYIQVGKMVFASANVTTTSSGTGNNRITMSLPVTAAFSDLGVVGSGIWYDTSDLKQYGAIVAILTTTTITFKATDGAWLEDLGGQFNANANAVANGDNLTMHVVYEAA